VVHLSGFEAENISSAKIGRGYLDSVVHFSGAQPLRRSGGGGVYRRYVKRVFDMAVVVLAAPLVLLVVGILALLIRRDGGPVFYCQNRVGRNGRIFRCWKLRSMIVDAEAQLAAHVAGDPAAREEWDTHQKLRNDPRITPVGRAIRKTSLDELPQLWNVLKGDMSLVGPRPMLPEQRDLYPGQAYFALRPGLTGFWQISDRNNSSFADRAIYDALYRDRLSFLTDVLVLLMTAWVVLRGTGY
jgi:lipopolysaccharide/colanic/teichoic acid biosynthesis glycosyltransferase